MPALIRAGAVGPPAKQAKSGGAGLSPAAVGGTGFQPCAGTGKMPVPKLKNFSKAVPMDL